MSGLNSISGLNKVSVDYRPEIKPAAVTPANPKGVEVGSSQVPRLRQDKGVATSIIQQLDVLLINAAKRSANANVAEQAASLWQSLQLAGAITEEAAAKLVALAR
ncbi:MAG: hypothetical protein J6P80_01260, partial [Kiritimatiellae bacterium]|nr:hypothetical protein [Kiritimatiellia bacterium]